MASRKATKNELAKPVRAGNRKAGVTKSGLPRAGRVAKPTKASRKTANTVGGKGLVGDEGYVPSKNTEQLKGSGPGRSSGLAEDVQTGGTLVSIADAMIDSGVVLDAIPTQRDTGVPVLAPRRARTPQQVAERERDRQVSQGRNRDAVVEGVRSGRIAVDTRSAEARQRFFTDDEDQSQEAQDVAAVTGGKLPVTQSPIRTADPSKGLVVTGRDATGKLQVSTQPRGNRLGGTRPLSRSVDKETLSNKKLAKEALAAAEQIQTIDEARQGEGSTGKGTGVEGMQKDALYTTGTAPTASDVGKPYQMIDVEGASTAAIGGAVDATTRTAQTALGRDEAFSRMSTEDRDQIDTLARGAVRGSPARTGGYIGSVVGSSEITPEFKTNVDATIAADSRTAIPEDIVDEQGYSFKDLLKDQPDLYAQLHKAVAGSVNRTSSISTGQGGRRTNTTTGVSDDDYSPILEGRDWRERLSTHLSSLPNDTKRKQLEDQLISAGVHPNSPITPQGEKETINSGSTVRDTVNANFGRMADANKAVSTAVSVMGRRRRGSTNSAPVEAITEQTGSEAARTLGINEATNRIIENEFMQPPSTKPSASALAGRRKVTDPSTGQPVSGKGVMAASQKMPLNAEGAAAPTDDQLKVMQATQPRLAAAFDRRPGMPGAMSITTSSGDVGSIPVRANDASKTDENPWGRGTQTGSVAYPKAAPIPGSLGVQFATPSGPQTGRVVPTTMPTASQIGSMTTREPSGRTPWNSLAPGSQVMVNDGSTDVTSVVRGNNQFGSILGSGGVPATPQNMRRAAARPTRQAGIAQAKVVAGANAEAIRAPIREASTAKREAEFKGVRDARTAMTNTANTDYDTVDFIKDYEALPGRSSGFGGYHSGYTADTGYKVTAPGFGGSQGAIFDSKTGRYGTDTVRVPDPRSDSGTSMDETLTGRGIPMLEGYSTNDDADLEAMAPSAYKKNTNLSSGQFK
jgi:hypothetical protein